MTTFNVTKAGTPHPVTVRQIELRFDAAGDLDGVSVLASTPGMDGDRRHALAITKPRAVAILTARGLTGPQQSAILGHLRALVQEAILDQFDDARNPA